MTLTKQEITDLLHNAVKRFKHKETREQFDMIFNRIKKEQNDS